MKYLVTVHFRAGIDELGGGLQRFEVEDLGQVVCEDGWLKIEQDGEAIGFPSGVIRVVYVHRISDSADDAT